MGWKSCFNVFLGNKYYRFRLKNCAKCPIFAPKFESKKMKQFVLLACLLSVLLACTHADDWEARLTQIKQLGDISPLEARSQLDSLSNEATRQTVHGQMKYDLLRIRLDDKADILPDTDTRATQLVDYFDHKGDVCERQEAYYYAGSVYRDLHDTPRAMEYFLQSMNIAEHSEACDSILLRNTYSNLSYLFNTVQDNQNYLFYALKEYQISVVLQRLENTTIIHLATAYDHVDSTRLALQYFDEALCRQRSNPVRHDLYILLSYYALHSHERQADECATLLRHSEQTALTEVENMALLAWGRYHQMKGDDDSAIQCYQTVMERDDNLEEMYDASRLLVTLYLKAGNTVMGDRYAARFVTLCDTLNLGKRQEMAATVNNLYKYQRDKDEEQQILQAGERYRIWGMSISALALLIVLVGGLVYEHKKNQMMQELLSLSGEMKELRNEKKTLQEEIDRQKQQNATFIRLLHQSEFESKAEDILSLLKRAADGRYTMTTDDWRQLYQVIDEEYPSFREAILQHFGDFTDQQMQVCYLLRIGMSRLEIQHISNLSRVTVWRWAKRFEWAEKE